MDLVAGLDVGTTKVSMVIAEVQPDGRVEVIGYGLAPSNGVQRGVVVDIDAASQAIRQAADGAQRVAGADISSVYVGVSGEHISSMNSKGIVAITQAQRVVRQEDVDRAIDSARVIVLPPDREIIHAIPRGFSIDGQDGVRAPVGMSGNRLQVETHIVHGVSSFLQNLGKCVRSAGFAIEGLVLQSFAAAKAVLEESDRGLGVAVLDMGGGTTDLAVYMNDNITHSAVLGLGGKHVTQDLAVGLQSSLAEAERVKIASGCASEAQVKEEETFSFTRIGSTQPVRLPRELLAQIIEPRMVEIFQLAEEAMVKGVDKKKLPGGLVLTGGASMLPGTVQLAEKQFGMPVRAGRVGRISGIVDKVSDPQYATAVGLVIHGSEQAPANGHVSDAGIKGVLGRIKDALLGTD